MTARQPSLSASQVSDVKRRLSDSEATNTFIQQINSYLDLHYTHGEEIDNYDQEVSAALIKIETSCKELADILQSRTPLPMSRLRSISILPT